MDNLFFEIYVIKKIISTYKEKMHGIVKANKQLVKYVDRMQWFCVKGKILTSITLVRPSISLLFESNYKLFCWKYDAMWDLSLWFIKDCDQDFAE